MSGNVEETKTPAVEGETKQGGDAQKKGEQQRRKSISKNGSSQPNEAGDSNKSSIGDSSKPSGETWAGVAAGGSSGTSVPITGGDASATGSNGTKVPITGGENDTKHSEEKKSAASSSSSSHGDEDSIPVTFHTEEKQQKKSRQPTKKERAETIKQQANKEFAAKKFASAIQLYNEALELDPSNHVLYSNRATARYNLAQEIAHHGEHPDAQQHCAIHSEVSPSWGASMSLYYGALEDALKAIELEPNYLKAYLRVGACLLALGKYQAAVQSFEAALTKFPNEESVKNALKDAREKATKLEEGFPLFHSFINLAGKQPTTKQAPPSDPAANESAARLHRELFGKRNALVQTPKPETRWQFYFEQPPNRRSTSAWESDFQRRQREREAEEAEDEGQYYDAGEQEQYFRAPSSSQSYYQHQYQPHPPPPRFPRPPFGPPPHHHQQQQQPFQSYSQPHHQQQQSSYGQPSYGQQHSHYGQQQQQQQQQPYHQQQQSSYGQQQQSYQQYQPSQSQQHQPSKKRSDNSIPNRKATVGYLQELCDNLRVSQYLPALIEQGVETVDDLMLLSPEAIRSVFPTLGHQARVLDWLNKAKGEL